MYFAHLRRLGAIPRAGRSVRLKRAALTPRGRAGLEVPAMFVDVGVRPVVTYQEDFGDSETTSSSDGIHVYSLYNSVIIANNFSEDDDDDPEYVIDEDTSDSMCQIPAEPLHSSFYYSFRQQLKISSLFR